MPRQARVAAGGLVYHAPSLAVDRLPLLQNPAVNLRTQLERTIEAAGLKPWPKLWHNLRATRQTELAKDHPIHVVCAWIGNSQAIAQEHYLQVREEDFAKAMQKPVHKGSEKMRSESEAGQDSRSYARKHLS